MWLVWTTSPAVETGMLYAAAHDITERKRAEAKIEELNSILAERNASLERQNAGLQAQSEALNAHQAELERQIDINHALLDASVDGIRLIDLEGRTLLANSVIERADHRGLRPPGHGHAARSARSSPSA